MAAAAAGPEDLEKRASEAFLDENFQLSADLYSQALVMDPKNANLLANRAQANIKLQNYTEAVADANKAIELDPSMSKAYLRKGIACMELEEYQTAKAALALGAALEENNPKFKDLMKDCDERIAEETYDISTKPMCNVPLTIVSPSIGSVEDSKPGNDNFHQPAVVKPKYRHEHYQKPDEVVLSIFAKGIPAQNVVVDFGEQILSVTIDIPGEDAYHFQPRLFGKIVPDRCRYQVLSTKIEVRLAKAEAINWASLEYNRENAAMQKPNVPSTSVVKARRPIYPSSKTRTDWDKLEAQVKKEEKEEKLDGDAALNKLFREIYQDADEDTRRAMSKSFVESNGTVLSTNWKEVGAKVVEGTPPDGMEMKKWEY